MDAKGATEPGPVVKARSVPSEKDPFRYYVAAVMVVACGLLLFLALLQFGQGGLAVGLPMRPTFSLGAWLAGVVFFVCIGLLAHRFRIRVGGADVSAGFLADFLSAALLGPLAGAVVASLPPIMSTGWREARSRNVFFMAAFFVMGGGTGLVYWSILGALGKSGYVLAIAGLSAGLVYFVLNFLIFAPVAWFRRRLSPRGWFDEAFGPFLPYHMFFLTLSLGLLYSFDRLGPPGFALFFLPVMGLIYAFRAFAYQRELARSLERFSLQMAASMITALDLKDNYTAQHSAAVAQYALDTASVLRMSHKQRSVAHLAGLLHDLGKISVPDEILNSHERLVAEEWLVIQGHSSAGQSVVSNMNEFEELGKIIRHHHERYDGFGYPDGVIADQIPLISRIVAVADSYSAMVSERPYSSKLRPEEAIAELKAKAGTQFDPRVVEAFLSVLRDASVEYRQADHLDFHLQFQKARFLGEID